MTDHAPLLPAYKAPNKPKQLKVDRHRTKLLPFRYNVVYEPGKIPPVITVHDTHLLTQISLKKKELTGLLRMKLTFSSSITYRNNSFRPSL